MARGRQSPLVLELSPKERELLPRWQRSTPMAAGLVRRGGMILLLADRHAQGQMAQMGGVQRVVVRQWAKRFLAQRLEGLGDAPGRGATGGFSPGGGDRRGAPGLRTPRSPGPQSLPSGGNRRGHLHRARAAHLRAVFT
jgi:hypothetical protein